MTWIVALLIIAVVVAVGATRLQSTQSDADMPSGVRSLIALYLLGLAVTLVYLVIVINSVDFPEPRITPVAAPDLTEKIDGTAPIIKAIDPATLVTNTPPAEVKVYGYHFDAASTLRFNGADHDSHYVGEHLLTAPLLSSDLFGTRAIRVEVKKGDSISPPQTMLVVSPNGELTVLSWRFQISHELQLLLLVLVAGALGSYVHAIKSLADFAGNQTLKASWALWYFTRPFLGMALALIFYAVIRGGFVAGSPADVHSVNPFGVVALSALVGMFSDKAAEKLGEIFDTLFKTQQQRKDPLVPLEITMTALPDGTVGTPYAVPLTARGAGQGALWSAQGLPAGVVIDAKSGLVHGTPTTAQPSTPLIVTLSDGAGHSVQKSLPLTIH